MEQSPFDVLLSRLQVLEQRLEELSLQSKEVLNFDEAVKYLKISASHLYALTSKHIIPVFKPGGKLLYFKQSDLKAWMLSNRKISDSEVISIAYGKLNRKA